MKAVKTVLKVMGEKMADTSVRSKCHPCLCYQPKMPAKLQAKIQQK